MSGNDPVEALARIETQLKFLQRMGVRYIPVPQASASSPSASSLRSQKANPDRTHSKPDAYRQNPPSPPSEGPDRVAEPPSQLDLMEGDSLPPPPEDREAALSEVVTQVSTCTLCKLHKNRTNTVPGEGNPAADLMFVGEGPGYHEDKQGRPFVGRAGNLLDKMIEAMGFRREEIFIGNVVKCRPPENRDPESDEIEQCEPYLKRQLEIIQPKVIVGLGRVAVQTLLKTKTPISRLRGKWHKYHHIDFMPTFHPAYLLRNPAEKRACWEDLQQVMARLEELKTGSNK